LIISDFPVGTFHTFVFYLADGIYLFILLLDKGKTNCAQKIASIQIRGQLDVIEDFPSIDALA
jgi:hypothetical protein